MFEICIRVTGASNNMQIKPILKVKNTLSELEKDFIELKDKKLKIRELKIKKEI